MKRLLEESEARLTPREAEQVWHSIAPGARPRPAPLWRRPWALAATLALIAVEAYVLDRWNSRSTTPAAPPIAATRPAPADQPPISADLLTALPYLDGGDAVRPVPGTTSRLQGTPQTSADPVPAAIPAPGPVELRELALAVPRAAPPDSVAGSAARGVIQGRVTGPGGAPEAFATVLLLDTRLGAQTRADGSYTLAQVPAGSYRIRVVKMGFDAVTDSVEVAAGAADTLDFALVEASVATLEEVQATGQFNVHSTTSSTVRQSVSTQTFGALPMDNLHVTSGLVSPSVPREPPHFRGGRRGDVVYQVDGVPVLPPPNSVGGTTPVNGDAFDAMFFQHYGVNPFVDPRDDRFATFALDVDNASYALTRAYLERDELPPPAAVRVEEFINALEQDYAPPEAAARVQAADSDEMPALAVRLDAAPSPFGAGLVLLRVGIKAREVPESARKPAVLTFVIDVSGSMAEQGRLETVKRALHTLLDRLNDDDRVGLVVFNQESRVVLPPLARRDRARIEAAIDGLQPNGSTNTEAGLVDGYAMADGAFHAGWVNRVILCTDGVANVGQTGAGSIHARIADQAKRGIELTAVGVGLGNYNDVLLEQLADGADGNYYYVDDAPEAERIFGEKLTGTLQTVARQTKVQVEFDPQRVRRYRLLGYENRDVADRDFRNDRVDAGEVGAGHEVTALFELALEEPDGAAADTLATVRLRYESPETKRVHESTEPLQRGQVAARIDRTAPMFRLDAAVAEWAEILRDSYWARESRLGDVAELARRACRELRDTPSRREVLALIEKSARLEANRELDARRFEDVRPRWEPDGTGGR